MRPSRRTWRRCRRDRRRPPRCSACRAGSTAPGRRGSRPMIDGDDDACQELMSVSSVATGAPYPSIGTSEAVIQRIDGLFSIAIAVIRLATSSVDCRAPHNGGRTTRNGANDGPQFAHQAGVESAGSQSGHVAARPDGRQRRRTNRAARAWPACSTTSKAAGLDDQVKSWVGTGDNKPITAEQITQAFGADKIARRAKDAGCSPQEAADELAKVLPQMVDTATPSGQGAADGRLRADVLRSYWQR